MEPSETNGLTVSEYEPSVLEQSFITEGKGICLRATRSRAPGQDYLAADTTDFRKWLVVNAPQAQLTVENAAILAMRSHDIWLPLAILASDTTLQVYLGLVANYVYDRLKGALRHDKHAVHLSVVHEDKTTGKLKRFDYSGPVEGLAQCVKKADLGILLEG